MRVVVVLGNQVPEGKVQEPYRSYCNMAVTAASDAEVPCTIVCAGGYTTPGVSISEGAAGCEYIRSKLPPSITGRVFLLAEERSKTTPENVRYILELLQERQVKFEEIALIGRLPQLIRVRAMLWRKRVALQRIAGCVPRIRLIAGPNTDNIIRRLTDWMLILLDFASPDGNNCFYRWLVRRERNG